MCNVDRSCYYYYYYYYRAVLYGHAANCHITGSRYTRITCHFEDHPVCTAYYSNYSDSHKEIKVLEVIFCPYPKLYVMVKRSSYVIIE